MANPARWRVVREDDNGNLYVLADDLDEAGARRLVLEFEARAHKQSYYAVPAPLED
ncbi:MAG: hypothetical protein IPQ07_01885 [Myxococcales bacterium]|nr:hypothetical protein [Myxococcales bacterium]